MTIEKVLKTTSLMLGGFFLGGILFITDGAVADFSPQVPSIPLAAQAYSSGINLLFGYVDPKWVGAKGDGIYFVSTGSTCVNGSKNITESGGAFYNSDIGKKISIPACGKAFLPLITTIVAVPTQGASRITVADDAGNSQSGVTSIPILYGTDDSTAIARAFAVSSHVIFPKGIFVVSTGFKTQAGGITEGSGGGGYLPVTFPGGWPTGGTIIAAIAGNANANYVISTGLGSVIKSLLVTPANFYGGNNYMLANYPSNSGNPSFGIYLGGGSTGELLGSQGFANADYAMGTGANLSNSVAFCGSFGIVETDIDGNVSSDIMVHDMVSIGYTNQAGMDNRGNFSRIVNNRFEWNARYGVEITGGEFMVADNIFDRDGWAGVFLNGGWGGTVSGNYFARNGAGGNGAVGRKAYCTVGSSCYVRTAIYQSAHIQIHYQRDVVITGNRYRSGPDDGNGGVVSPAWIYSTGTDVPTASNAITIGMNAGEEPQVGGFGGCNSSYPGSANPCTFNPADSNVTSRK